MAITVTSNTTFTQIHDQYKPGWFGSGENTQIRGGADANGGVQVYTHNPLMGHGRGEDALARRLEKYQEGANLVKQAMANQYGADMAEAVFRRVSQETGRNLSREVTRGDLPRLSAALQTMVQAKRAEEEAQVKQDSARTWRSGDRDPVEVRLTDDTRFSLPDQFNRDFVERGDIRFTGGELRLQLSRGPDERTPEAYRQDNLTAVAEFIRSKFGFEPGTTQFNNVANNILRYVQQGAAASATGDIHEITGGKARLTAQEVRISYGIAVDRDGVHVSSTLNAPVGFVPGPDQVGDEADPYAGSRYRREESILIDPYNLTAAPSAFDPLENLTGAGRQITTVLPR